MSAICVFTPIVTELAWPALAQAIAASLGAAGYRCVRESAAAAERVLAESDGKAERAVEFDAEAAGELAGGLGDEERLSFEKDGYLLAFRRSPDGGLRVCVSGREASDAELEAVGRKAMNAFLQEHVRRRVESELKKRGYSLDEERLPDGTIRLRAKGFA